MAQECPVCGHLELDLKRADPTTPFAVDRWVCPCCDGVFDVEVEEED